MRINLNREKEAMEMLAKVMTAEDLQLVTKYYGRRCDWKIYWPQGNTWELDIVKEDYRGKGEEWFLRIKVFGKSVTGVDTLYAEVGPSMIRKLDQEATYVEHSRTLRDKWDGMEIDNLKDHLELLWDIDVSHMVLG